MKTKHITVQNSQKQTLAATLDLPEDRQPSAFALFAHCFTCGKQFKASAFISRFLASEGIGVLRFDFRGIGDSDGTFEDTNFTTNVGDILSIADYMGQVHQPPRLLIGHSLGGTAVLKAARHVTAARAVVTIGSPAQPGHVARLVTHRKKDLTDNGKAEVIIDGRRFTFTPQFVEDVENTDMTEHIAKINKALLIMHAPFDDTVGIDNAAAIYKAARHPKSFVALDGASHLLASREESNYVAGLITAWASRYYP